VSAGNQLFLDTSIQVDRFVAENDPARREPLEALLASFNYLFACTYSRLEFKRVVIQNLGLTLRYLREEKSFFGAFHKANRLQQQRRAGTLTNIMAWVGYKLRRNIEVTLGEDLDHELTIKAESFIRNAIRYLWKRFDTSVDTILDRTECRRAAEPPRLNSEGDLDVSIPQSRCKDKRCNNANFLRSKLPIIRNLCQALEKIKSGSSDLTEELEAILKTLRSIEHDLDKAYDYKTCLAIGDLWMHLECLTAGVRNFGTTNYKESQILCPILGLEMKLPNSKKPS
jgi:hypothetical protein